MPRRRNVGRGHNGGPRHPLPTTKGRCGYGLPPPLFLITEPTPRGLGIRPDLQEIPFWAGTLVVEKEHEPGKIKPFSSGAPNEVTYYDGDEDPYGMNVERMDSHGGWIATPSDLVRFLTHVGFAGTPSLLTRETIAAMMTPCPVHPDYARGWFVDKSGDSWHSGGMPGTRSSMERTANGVCWAALANTDCEMDLNKVVQDMVHEVKAWRVSGARGSPE